MKLLEYEAKQLLGSYSVPIPEGELIHDNLPSQYPAILKSQVPTGGRGLAGGIKIVSGDIEAHKVIPNLLQLTINGFTPSVLLSEEVLAIDRELYLSIVVDPSSADITILAHRDGGIDIEQSNEDIVRCSATNQSIDIVGQTIADYYQLEDKVFVLTDLLEQLIACFVASDATLLEINPLVLTDNGHFVAADCKIILNDTASFRHPDWQFEALPTSSNFVSLDPNGTVATIANGAGLAMATVDTLIMSGLKVTNFLDIGGGASKDGVLAALRELMKYNNVQAIVINIFAGITRCDEVAQAVITASDEIDSLPPLYIRLSGTNYKVAAKLLHDRSIALFPTLEACVEAARKDLS